MRYDELAGQYRYVSCNKTLADERPMPTAIAQVILFQNLTFHFYDFHLALTVILQIYCYIAIVPFLSSPIIHILKTKNVKFCSINLNSGLLILLVLQIQGINKSTMLVRNAFSFTISFLTPKHALLITLIKALSKHTT